MPHEAGAAAVTIENDNVWITGGFSLRNSTHLLRRTKIINNNFDYTEVIKCKQFLDLVMSFNSGSHNANRQSSSLQHLA